jgi:hypothetical protein
MAKGDLKPSRRTGGSFSSTSRGGGYSYDYDDEGRGESLTLWDEFKGGFEFSGYSEDWLLNTKGAEVGMDFGVGLYDARLYKYVHNMTSRYSIHDWAWRQFEDDDNNDGRVRRIVIKKLGLESWLKLQLRAKQLWDTQREKDRKAAAERAEKWEQERAVFHAERIKRETEEVNEIRKDVQLVTGSLQADFNSAFSMEESYGREAGDWLDDAVSAYQSGYGFGEEVRRPAGVKLQITISIDLSNSMYYNKVDKAAAKTIRDVYLALEQLKDQYPNDLFVCAFTFSDNGYSSSEQGKRAENLTRPYWSGGKDKKSTERHLGAVEQFRSGRASFTGTDTWFYPLFEEIEKWENEHSDEGALKLDIVLTDAVIEHPTDIKRSDKVQERRNGTLHTIFLNFLKESEWVDSDLPLRCVQYGADPSNISGLLRTLISEFVQVYL